MEIIYLGHSSFRLRGKTATVVTDPFDEKVGLKFPSAAADIITVSHEHGDHNAVERVKTTEGRKEPFVIRAPGEYEINGVSVFGNASFHDDKKGAERGNNTFYVIHIDDLTVVHLGDLGHELSEKQVERINGVDVLLVPVGGVYTLDPVQAKKVISQVEPVIVIPMHYKVKGMEKSFDKLASVDEFLKEAGLEGATKEEKLNLQKSTLPENREVVVLKTK